LWEGLLASENQYDISQIQFDKHRVKLSKRRETQAAILIKRSKNMTTGVPTAVPSESQSPADELASTSKHHIKFALCVSPLLVFIALAVYLFIIDM
jgi:hypothetical protein